MPLSKGKSKEAFSHNVKAEIAAGKPTRQAVAIAYAQKRRAMAKGGVVGDVGIADPGKPVEEPGNIDLKTRPIAYNPDGSYSTVRTMTVEDGPGRYANIPSVMDTGEVVGEQAAREAYKKSGHHLGKFGDLNKAVHAAENLHEEQASDYDAQAARGNPTVGPPGPPRVSGVAIGPVSQAQELSVPGLAFQVSNSGNTGKGYFSPEAYAKRNNGIEPGLQDDPVGNGLIAGIGGGLGGKALQSGIEALGARGTQAEAPAVARSAFDAVRGETPNSVPWDEVVGPAARARMEAATGQFAPKKMSEGGVVRAGVPKRTPNLPDWAERFKLVSDIKGPITAPSTSDPTQRFGKEATIMTDASPTVHGVNETPEDLFKDLADHLHSKHSTGGTAQNYAEGGVVNPKIAEGEVSAQEFGDLESALQRQPGEPLPPGPGQPSAADHAAYEGAKAGMASVKGRDLTPEEELASRALAAQQAAPGLRPVTSAPAPARRSPEELLSSLEAKRQQALAGSNPSTGARIGRGIASGLTAFGGGTPTDWAAQDRANRADINAEYGQQKNAFLAQPGQLAAQAADVGASPESQQVRLLAGKLLGDPSLVQGMSASQVQAVMPLIGAYKAAQNSGNALKQAEILAQMKNAVEERKLGQGEKHLSIEQQNAESNRIRALKEGAVGADPSVKAYQVGKTSTRGAPAYGQSQNDLLALDKIQPLLNKPHLTPTEVDLIAGELAKVASGSVGNVHLTEKLAAPTLVGRYARWKQYLTGQPGDAGYDRIIKDTVIPYVNELRKTTQANLYKHDLDYFNAHRATLPPDFAAEEEARIKSLAPQNEPATPADPYAQFKEQ